MQAITENIVTWCSGTRLDTDEVVVILMKPASGTNRPGFYKDGPTLRIQEASSSPFPILSKPPKLPTVNVYNAHNVVTTTFRFDDPVQLCCCTDPGWVQSVRQCAASCRLWLQGCRPTGNIIHKGR